MLTRACQIALGLFLASAIGWSHESVCLKSGFCLQADSHVVEGEHLRLTVGSGSIELTLSEIASIETVDVPTPLKTAVVPQKKVDMQTLLVQAADSEGIDRDFVRSVAKVESGFRQNVVSSKGAIGLMQLMPPTASDLHVDPFKADENALAGARYLRTLLLRYHGNSALALAAYNAGPGAVTKWGGIPPYQETASYVKKVTREYDRLKLRSATAKDLKRPTSTD